MIRTILFCLLFFGIVSCSKKEIPTPQVPDDSDQEIDQPSDGKLDTLGNWNWVDVGNNRVEGSQVLFWNADTGYVVNNVYNPSAGLKATYDGGKTWFPKDGTYTSIQNFGYSKLHLAKSSEGVLYSPYVPLKNRSFHEPNYIRMNFEKDEFSGYNVIRSFYSSFVQSVQYLGDTRFILEDRGVLNIIGANSRHTFEFDAEELPTFVHFTSLSNGWVGTKTGKLYSSTDQGKSWTLSFSAPSPTVLYHMYFFDAQIGCIVTNSNCIYRTTNGGKDWEKVMIPAPLATTNEVYYLDRELVIVSSIQGFMNIGNYIYETRDAGATWRRSARIGEHTVQGMAFDKANKVWAITSKGLLQLEL
jgi:hypothetical protein